MRIDEIILPALIGGIVSGAILIAEHYGLDRAKLRRPDAYTLGVATLDLGYLIYLIVAGDPLDPLIAFLGIQGIGGVLVKGAYWLDSKKPPPPPNDGQLQETLNLNERFRAEIARLKEENQRLVDEAKSSPLKDHDLTDIAALAHSALVETERAVGIVNTVHKKNSGAAKPKPVSSI